MTKDQDTPIPKGKNGKYWACILGPVEFPSEISAMDIAPRRAAMAAVKKTYSDEMESSEELDFNCWSEWGLSKEKADAIQAAWFSNEDYSGCSELQRLEKEVQRLESMLGKILMKTGPVQIDAMDINDFKRTPGFVEETKDGNFYRYEWIAKSR